MAEPRVTYEQILRELQAGGQLAPPRPMPSPSPSPTPGPSPLSPEGIIAERMRIQKPFATMGQFANPETVMANQGQPPKPNSLIQMLMGLLQ